MGNSDANRIADSLTDGPSTNITLGATAGASTHTLTSAQIPGHTHTFSGTTSSDGAHTHTYEVGGSDSNGGCAADGGVPVTNNPSTSTAGAHTHTFSGTTGSTGSGGSHNNLQPGMFATIYIKL
jgi:microcystin-dependent protein